MGGRGIGWARRRTGGRLFTAAGSGAATRPRAGVVRRPGAALSGQDGSQALLIKWAGGRGIGWARRRTGGRLFTAVGFGAATRPCMMEAPTAKRLSAERLGAVRRSAPRGADLRAEAAGTTVAEPTEERRVGEPDGRAGFADPVLLCRGKTARRPSSSNGLTAGELGGRAGGPEAGCSRPQASGRPPGLFKRRPPSPPADGSRAGGWALPSPPGCLARGAAAFVSTIRWGRAFHGSSGDAGGWRGRCRRRGGMDLARVVGWRRRPGLGCGSRITFPETKPGGCRRRGSWPARGGRAAWSSPRRLPGARGGGVCVSGLVVVGRLRDRLRDAVGWGCRPHGARELARGRCIQHRPGGGSLMEFA